MWGENFFGARKMRGHLIIAPKVMFSIGIFLKIEDCMKGHYIFWQMIVELLIFMRISIIEKFLDVVSYLSVVMYVNFACTCTHTHTHSESLVLWFQHMFAYLLQTVGFI